MTSILSPALHEDLPSLVFRVRLSCTLRVSPVDEYAFTDRDVSFRGLDEIFQGWDTYIPRNRFRLFHPHPHDDRLPLPTDLSLPLATTTSFHQ